MNISWSNKTLSQSHKLGISFGSSGTYGEKNEILNTLKVRALFINVPCGDIICVFVSWTGQQSCKTKITKFNDSIFCYKNIFRFDISMNTLNAFDEHKWLGIHDKSRLGSLVEFLLKWTYIIFMTKLNTFQHLP